MESNFNKFFKHIFCINLDRRPDRWSQIQEEFKKHNITNVERIAGVDGQRLDYAEQFKSLDGQKVSFGDYGCTLSHLSVVQKAKELNLPYYVVFEDDAEFCDNFNDLLPGYLAELRELENVRLHKKADMIFFGCSRVGMTQNLTPHIQMIYKAYTTHAMVIRQSMYDDLIKCWSRIEKVDVAFSVLQSEYTCLAFTPNLVYQRKSFSDILNKDSDYVHLRQQ